MENMLRVYITNLGKYNEGYLIGEWLDLPTTEEAIEESLKNIGINEEYEEYFITDYESDCGLKCGEYENIFTLNEQLNELEDLCENDEDYEKIKGMIEEGIVDSIEEAIEEFASYGYISGWSAVDYEEDIVKNCYNIDNLVNGWLSGYISIDYEAMARDDYNITETKDGVLYKI